MAKFIKFRDAASVSAAKAQQNAGQLDIVKSENALVYEGAAVIRGISDTQLEYVNRKVKEENDAKAKITFSVTPNATFVKGTDTTFTLKVTCTFDGVNVAADATPKFKAGSVELSGVTKPSTGVYQVTVTKSETTTFGVEATVKGVARTDAVTVKAYNQVIFGVSDTILNPADSSFGTAVTNMTKRGVSESASGTYNFATAGYCYIIVPSDVSVGTLPNGFDSTGNTLTTIFTQDANYTGSGITYKVFRTGEKQTSALTVRIK